MILNAADVEHRMALLDGAERNYSNWRGPLSELKAELARGRRLNIWMGRAALPLAAALGFALHGERWDSNDLLPFLAALLALNALRTVFLSRLVPATAHRDRIEALAAHFEATT